MKKRIIFISLLALSIMAFTVQSCKHEPPLTVNDDNGNGGGNGGGGNGGGGTGGGGTGGGGTGSGIPCDPDTVYFENQILPFLVSNCSAGADPNGVTVGCHDAATAEDGVILISYSSVMNTAEVTPFDIWEGDLYEVIATNNISDRMPPPPNAPLTQAQIDLIALWINQGAQNLTCNPNYGVCDSVNVTYNGTVKPIIQAKCQGCHNNTNPGGGINLSNYAGVQAAAVTGQLVGSIEHAPGFSAMPKNTTALPACEVAQIRNWVAQGAQNN